MSPLNVCASLERALPNQDLPDVSADGSIAEANEGFDEDLTRTAQTVEKWAGVEVRGKAAG